MPGVDVHVLEQSGPIYTMASRGQPAAISSNVPTSVPVAALDSLLPPALCRGCPVELPQATVVPSNAGRQPRRASARIRRAHGATYQDATARAVALKAHRLEGATIVRAPSTEPVVAPFLHAELLRTLGEACRLSKDDLRRLGAASPVIADID
jgi:hypothetical protein